MILAETVQRIEPARLEEPGEAIGAVSLRFPVDALEMLFPRLFPET
jgi:hypothetical protein